MKCLKLSKCFKKKVENQLGKTIKSLRSDRGGEYMSQEFLDHLKDQGIIAHRTPPYTPQHNDVSKRRNRTVLDMNSLITQEASGSLEDLEIIQEEDTHPSKDTSLNQEKDDLEIDEPQSDIVPIRRSTRTRHALDHRMCLYIDAKEHELGDLGEPANYKAALFDPESEKWLNAMNVEIQSMKENDVWVLVELPLNGKTVGIDYEETFSPVADIRAIRILIAIAAYYDDEIWQIDVKSAFLNGSINEEVYKEKPEGFVNPKFPDRNLGDLHWTTVKNILKYLRNTKEMFLVYGVWVRKFIYELRVVSLIDEPISMYCDNTGAIAIANESGITKGARYFRAKVHYLREVIEYGDVKLGKVHTDDNLADPFTKALAFLKHSEHTRDIGMLPASSLMGFFEKKKLTRPNFVDWYRQLRIVLSIEDKWNYLEQPIPLTPVVSAGQHVAPEILAAHTVWIKVSKEIAGLMLMTMEPDI
uniref:Retrotransposon protein, putative, Ty1-copia subclass n=1 Tax=Tanacetum cinerariifolium TaxID=118510 RepID=A0A6L2KGN2_TANCI|nr:retrotransposon protein, putative, Ty1-copia subclass [Tanacetum cinerariifolium]